MDLTETFVVRIYRRDGAPGGSLTGTVESIEKETTQRFSSFEELRSILEHSRPSRKARRQSRRTQFR